MKPQLRFVSMLMLIVALAVTACDTGKKDDNSSLLLLLSGGTPQTYAIGDTGPSGVGIVFYVTDGGLHGLEVAPVDQSSPAAWSTIDEGFANGSTPLPVDIGAGSTNTDAIILQNGGAASAAQICRDYRAAEEGDWFLPSRDELDAVWDNLVDDGEGNNNGVGDFVETLYWSSSENDANSAWSQFFLDGSQLSTRSKVNTYWVRAVRAF